MQEFGNLDDYEVVPLKKLFSRKKRKENKELKYFKLLRRLGLISEGEYKVIEGLKNEREVKLELESVENVIERLINKNLIRNINAVTEEFDDINENRVAKFLKLLS
jgi:hypothetical protein